MTASHSDHIRTLSAWQLAEIATFCKESLNTAPTNSPQWQARPRPSMILYHKKAAL